MSISPSWLSKLKTPELHRLAILLGTPCSGTKAARITGIEQAISPLLNPSKHTTYLSKSSLNVASQHVRLVSIDMGIKNLAFACFTTETRPDHRNGSLYYGPVTLKAWRKIDVASSCNSVSPEESSRSSEGPQPSTLAAVDATKASSDPDVYANYAFRIISSILDDYNPTHVIIERQRFRSGGSSAVLEWTLRVGVFEGMLYAVLRALRGTHDQPAPAPLVEGVLPLRVNRFWLESRNTGMESADKVKIAGKEVKKAKISIVGQLLEKACSGRSEQQDDVQDFRLPLDLHEAVQNLVEYFQTEVHRKPMSRKKKELLTDTKVSKLDDLADCLLQGLAWLNWQNNKFRVQTLGSKAFNLSDHETLTSASKNKS